MVGEYYLFLIIIVKEIEMELNEEIENAQLDIQLLNSQMERLQDRVRRLESMVAAMAIMLDLIPEKSDTK